MKQKKNIPNARERILEAACRVFANSNFDAARVDGIAAEAGVPKSLIYYHFKSKDEILETLLNGFFSNMGELVRKAFTECRKSGQDASRLFSRVYYRFLYDNRDLVRVALAESLKKDSDNPPMLRLLDGYTAIKSSLHPDADQATLINLASRLFFSLIPAAALICMGEKFSSRYGFDNDETAGVFSALHAEVHKLFQNGGNT